MNKETKLQLLELLKETRDYLGVEDTPEYSSMDFMPIASDRHAHTEAVLALAHDVSDACDTTPADSTELSAPEITAD